MNLSLAHTCLSTGDRKGTLRFYRDALGMGKVFDFNKDGKLYGYYLKMSQGNYLEVFEDDAVGDEVKGPYLHLCLETDDIHAARDRLVAAGVECTDIKKGCDNTWQTWFKDPNGLDIELHMYTEKSSQLTGANCEVDW